MSPRIRPADGVLAALWALPWTLPGLVLWGLARLSGGRGTWVEGALEVHGGLVAALLRRDLPLLGRVEALTLGHVVLGRDPAVLARTRPHERAHVRQYGRWGPLFVPAYLAFGLALRLRGRDPYRDNPFEVEARQAEVPPPGI